MTTRLILSLITVLSSSCSDYGLSPQPSKYTTITTTSLRPSVNTADYSQELAMRKQFMAQRFKYFFITSEPTINTYPTRHYGNTFPKAAALGDYNKKPFQCLMVVNLDWPFEKKLPASVLSELNARNLRNKKLVDIFWVIQPLKSLGGNKYGSDQNISYLKAHGWADPDEPLNYNGTRIKRDFLYGLYDLETDISLEVKKNILKPFEIHIHDGMYSPQTAAVKLPNNSPDSTAFWSLVIDHENPNGQVRALATFHWLISDRDEAQFRQESFLRQEISDSRGIKAESDLAMRYDSIGDYITMLKTTSVLKNSVLVNKLKDMFD